MLEKVFCSNIAPSLSSGNHLFYKAEYSTKVQIALPFRGLALGAGGGGSIPPLPTSGGWAFPQVR